MSRRRRWSGALVLALALAGAVLVVAQPARSRATADFTVFVSAGRLVLRGHADRVYDQAWLGPEIARSAAGAALDPRLPFNEPRNVSKFLDMPYSIHEGRHSIGWF